MSGKSFGGRAGCQPGRGAHRPCDRRQDRRGRRAHRHCRAGPWDGFTGLPSFGSRAQWGGERARASPMRPRTTREGALRRHGAHLLARAEPHLESEIAELRSTGSSRRGSRACARRPPRATLSHEQGLDPTQRGPGGSVRFDQSSCRVHDDRRRHRMRAHEGGRQCVPAGHVLSGRVRQDGSRLRIGVRWHRIHALPLERPGLPRDASLRQQRRPDRHLRSPGGDDLHGGRGLRLHSRRLQLLGLQLPGYLPVGL